MQKILDKFNIKLNSRLSLILPYLIIALLFIVLPMILIIVKAFAKVESSNEFDNFFFIKEAKTWLILWRSVWLGIATAFICLIIGLPYAFFVSTTKSNSFKTYGISLIVSPLVIFTISKILSLRGFFTYLVAGNVQVLNSQWFMLVGLVYLNLPFMIIPLYTVFRDMPKNILEASNDLGYNHFSTLIKVALPYSIKAIFSGIALVFLMAASSIAISDKLLPNGGSLLMIGNAINDLANPANPFDMARASTIVIITSITLLGVYGLFYLIPYLFGKIRNRKQVKNG